MPKAGSHVPQHANRQDRPLEAYCSDTLEALHVCDILEYHGDTLLPVQLMKGRVCPVVVTDIEISYGGGKR